MKTFILLLLVCSGRLFAGYSFCQPLVIQHSKVRNTDQANYVLTVSDTDSKLATTDNGGYARSASGNDVVFAADSNAQQLLNWDPLEVYDPVTGRIVTHVRVGTISHVTDTTIYRCAGNAAIQNFQGGPVGSVWPGTYKGVWHLNETSGSQKDSTTNGYNSSSAVLAVQGAATGKIGGANSATGPSDNVTVPGGGTLSLPGGYTISAWVSSNSWGSGYRAVFRANGATNPAAVYVHGGKLVFYYSSGDAVTGASILGTGTLYHIALVTPGPGQPATLYVNGNPDATAGQPSSPLGTVLTLNLCGDSFGQRLNGICDEVRLSDTAFSADRIATDYNNQSSPATFYIPGSWMPVAARSGLSQFTTL